LGLGLIKWELEDLAFSYLKPDKFKELKELVNYKRCDRERYINKFVGKLSLVMEEMKIEGEVIGRPKHFYSIYRKMMMQNLTFEEIYDLLAVRVLVKTPQDCYSLLGLIHEKWKPIEGKFKDYIAMPKANMYQSLHTTIMGPEGRSVEIQIRSYEMNHIAEYGVASHWTYKETDKTKKAKVSSKQEQYINKLAWLRKSTEESLNNAETSKEFLENIKMDLMMGEIFVFSPKGDVYSLSEGATPIDFAYLVHTEVGNKCTGSKVNNKIVHLNSPLKTGDIVEIMTSKKAKPSPDWLAFVKTSAAKTKIKAWLNKQNREKHVEHGEELLTESAEKLLLDPAEVLGKKYIPKILKKYGFNSERDLFLSVGRGDISALAVTRYCEEIIKKNKNIDLETVEETIDAVIAKPKKAKHLGIGVKGIDDVMLHLAKCCRPIPGDKIVGLVTLGYGISVHRKDCPNIKDKKERIIEVFWDNSDGNTYQFDLEVLGYDRLGLLKDVLNVIADKNSNVINASARKINLSEVIIKLTIELSDMEHLQAITGALRQIKDVYDVYRRKV